MCEQLRTRKVDIRCLQEDGEGKELDLLILEVGDERIMREGCRKFEEQATE